MEGAVLAEKLRREEAEVSELQSKLGEAAFFGQSLLDKNETLNQTIDQLRSQNTGFKAAATDRAAEKLHAIFDARREGRRSTFCDMESVAPLKRRSTLGARAAEWDEELHELLEDNKQLRRRVGHLEHEQERLLQRELEEREKEQRDFRRWEERERSRQQERERHASGQREDLEGAKTEAAERLGRLEKREQALEGQLKTAQRHLKSLGTENAELRHMEQGLRSELQHWRSECQEHSRIRQELMLLIPSPTDPTQAGLGLGLGQPDFEQGMGGDALALELGTGGGLGAVELSQASWVQELQQQLDHLRDQLLAAKNVHLQAEQLKREEQRQLHEEITGLRLQAQHLRDCLEILEDFQADEARACSEERQQKDQAQATLQEEFLHCQRAELESDLLRREEASALSLSSEAEAELRQLSRSLRELGLRAEQAERAEQEERRRGQQQQREQRELSQQQQRKQQEQQKLLAGSQQLSSQLQQAQAEAEKLRGELAASRLAAERDHGAEAAQVLGRLELETQQLREEFLKSRREEEVELAPEFAQLQREVLQVQGEEQASLERCRQLHHEVHTLQAVVERFQEVDMQGSGEGGSGEGDPKSRLEALEARAQAAEEQRAKDSSQARRELHSCREQLASLQEELLLCQEEGTQSAIQGGWGAAEEKLDRCQAQLTSFQEELAVRQRGHGLLERELEVEKERSRELEAHAQALAAQNAQEAQGALELALRSFREEMQERGAAVSPREAAAEVAAAAAEELATIREEAQLLRTELRAERQRSVGPGSAEAEVVRLRLENRELRERTGEVLAQEAEASSKRELTQTELQRGHAERLREAKLSSSLHEERALEAEQRAQAAVRELHEERTQLRQLKQQPLQLRQQPAQPLLSQEHFQESERRVEQLSQRVTGLREENSGLRGLLTRAEEAERQSRAQQQHLAGRLQEKKAGESEGRTQELSQMVADLRKETVRLRKHLIRAEQAERDSRERSKEEQVLRDTREGDLTALIAEVGQLGQEARRSAEGEHLQAARALRLQQECNQLLEQAARAPKSDRLASRRREMDLLRTLRAVRHIDRDLCAA